MKEEWMAGKQEGRIKRRKDGEKEESKEAWKEGKSGGRKERRMAGRKKGKTDWMDGWTEDSWKMNGDSKSECFVFTQLGYHW